MQRAFIIIDPQHEYARELIRIARVEHGLQPICVYIDSRAELYKRTHFPELRDGSVLAHYYLDRHSPEELARQIKSRFDVVGMMPYFEQSLDPARLLMQALGWDWNEPTVLQRFRDKSALKDHLRKNHPEIPLGQSRKVQSIADVLSAPLPERFVIKPNDGFANRDVGFFARNDERSSIEEYLAHSGNGTFILEEMLYGTEFAVNGQMDEHGRASTVSILEYERVPANGKPNIYHRTIHVPRSHPRYHDLAAYAEQVMNASGLKRAPFHLELMDTPDGPRLIEVGARFGGTRYVFATNAVHDNKFSHFSLAAHYWLWAKPYQGTLPQWDFYDRVSYLHLDGIAGKTERIYKLEGVAAIERLAEFDGWVVQPQVGGLMRRTVDLYTVPYSLHLKGFAGRPALIEVSESVKRMLRINAGVPRTRRLLVDARARIEQAQMRARWWLGRLRNVG